VGLDPVARRVVRDHIREVRGEFGTTVVMTTHDMDEADEMCDTLAIMHHGRVSAIGSPASLKASVGPEATLDDVFIHFSGSTLDEGGGYRDVVRTRRTARRLG
jgi:ABC-2 type transport system ATP-binding protein